MAIRTYDILLDSYNSTMPEPIVGRQGDKNGAVTLHVTITDRGTAVDLTGQTVNLIAETAKGTAVIADNAGVTLTDAVNGKFDYAIPNALWSEAGKITKAYFSLNDTDGQETTYDLIFIVKKAIDISQDKADDYITVIDGTVRDLQSKVDAIYATYQTGDFYNKSEIDSKDAALRERLNTPIIIDQGIIIGGDVKGSDLMALQNLEQDIDTEMFNLGFITDTHDDKLSSDSGKPTNYSLQHLSNILLLNRKLDAIVAGGDNIDGFSNSYDGLVSEYRKFANKLMLTSINQADKFILLGNHDDGSLRYINWLKTDMKKPMPKVIPLDELNKMIGADEAAFGEQRDDNSPYFYKDYENKKVRLIGLNSVDNPDDAVDDHGGPKYPRQINMGYRQEQLNWLANTALQNVPEGYVTLIVSHIQGDVISDISKYYNQDVVSEIINNFKDGTKTNIVSGAEDWEVNVNVDFSGQGKRDFGAYIHGHQHKEVSNSANGYNNIGVTCSLSPMENLGTPQEDAWNVITVDNANRKIILKGFGRATDREFEY